MKRISTRERNFLRVFSTSFRALKEYSSCCCSDFSSSPREFSLFLFNRIFTRRFSREFHDRKWPNEFYTKKLQRVADIFAVKLIYFCCWGAVDFLIFFFSFSLSFIPRVFSHTLFYPMDFIQFYRAISPKTHAIFAGHRWMQASARCAAKICVEILWFSNNWEKSRRRAVPSYTTTRLKLSHTRESRERETEHEIVRFTRATPSPAQNRTVAQHTRCEHTYDSSDSFHFASLISQKQMIRKVAKSPWMSFVKKSVGVLFVAEAAAFGASYYLWYRLNTNQGELSWERFRENTLQLQSYLHSQTRDITVSSTIRPFWAHSTKLVSFHRNLEPTNDIIKTFSILPC